MKKNFSVRCDEDIIDNVKNILETKAKFKYMNRNRLINELLEEFIKKNM